jgi:hypothetical protein
MGCTPHEAKENTSLSDVLGWQEIFRSRWTEPTPEHYYLAQIAHMVYLLQFVLGGKPKLEFKDFLMQFTFEEGKFKNNVRATTEETTEEQLARKERARANSVMWKAWAQAQSELLEKKKANVIRMQKGASRPSPTGKQILQINRRKS